MSELYRSGYHAMARKINNGEDIEKAKDMIRVYRGTYDYLTDFTRGMIDARLDAFGC